MQMTEIIFSTPYTTKYTKAQKTTKQTLFVSKYGVKEFNTVVSIETRPKKKRFKSRLVSKI